MGAEAEALADHKAFTSSWTFAVLSIVFWTVMIALAFWAYGLAFLTDEASPLGVVVLVGVLGVGAVAVWASPPGQRWYPALLLLSIIVLIPIYFLVVRAISDPGQAFTGTVRRPVGVRWDGFSKAWDRGNLGTALIRSLVTTVAITVSQVLTSVLAAYAFAFLRFPFKRFLFAFFMATMLLPLEVTLLPNLQTMRDLGWFDSYQGLVTPFAAAALGTFLVRQGFLGIPNEIRDAARLEGWGHLQFLFRFAVPLTRPVIASFTVISFLGAFNQYLWPRAIINDTDNWATIQLALRGLTSSIEEFNIPVAGTIIAALPVVVLLIAFQRQIVRGLTAGAVKG